jgi:hypothetical protein
MFCVQNNQQWNNQSNKWNTGDVKKEAHQCSLDTPKKTIVIAPEVYSAIIKLTKDVEVEWQALLKGVVLEDIVKVTGYYIPKQEVTGASVKNLDCIDDEFVRNNNIVATIHSHSNMGVFFSPTDEQDTNSSIIKHHIVVNNKLEFKAVSKVTLPCGLSKSVDANIEVLFPFVEIEGLDNITEVVPNVQIYTPNYITPNNKGGFYSNGEFANEKPNMSKKQYKKWNKSMGGIKSYSNLIA